jgi:MOSC domain-containing protein YiiM
MSIDGIFLASAASQPMQSIQKGTLVAGQGLQGDRYSTHQGTYSTLGISKQKPSEREPGRQLTMMSADGVQAAFAHHGLKPPASLGDLCRNIVLSGICSQDLLGAVGSVIQLGDQCLIFVHRHCKVHVQ